VVGSSAINNFAQASGRWQSSRVAGRRTAFKSDSRQPALVWMLTSLTALQRISLAAVYHLMPTSAHDLLGDATGFSELIGSWNTVAISSRKPLQSRSEVSADRDPGTRSRRAWRCQAGWRMDMYCDAFARTGIRRRVRDGRGHVEAGRP
jgi:hypothetical protein